MKKRSIYLDTSVINFLFADDSPEKREITREFFENFVRLSVYEVYVSPVVIDEIQRTADEKRRACLLDVVGKYGLQLLDTTKDIQEIQSLAQMYIEGGVIPRRKLEDALHVAIATVNGMDVLLSWNFRHLANLNKETRVQAVNLEAGYTKPLRMLTPLEVVYEEE